MYHKAMRLALSTQLHTLSYMLPELAAPLTIPKHQNVGAVCR